MGRVAYADARQHQDILHALVRALNSGKQRVWLATPYFLPTWSVRRSLRRAASKGLDASVADRSAHRSPLGTLRRASLLPASAARGVRIFEYQPCFLHLKMAVVDDWVSVGSCNFDHWNLRFNLEANIERWTRR
jgi:phosphatidylserine/phosphatidylglycerophosphate/cardiolipin synthase-like enzyme